MHESKISGGSRIALLIITLLNCKKKKIKKIKKKNGIPYITNEDHLKKKNLEAAFRRRNYTLSKETCLTHACIKYTIEKLL